MKALWKALCSPFIVYGHAFVALGWLGAITCLLGDKVFYQGMRSRVMEAYPYWLWGSAAVLLLSYLAQELAIESHRTNIHYYKRLHMGAARKLVFILLGNVLPVFCLIASVIANPVIALAFHSLVFFLIIAKYFENQPETLEVNLTLLMKQKPGSRQQFAVSLFSRHWSSLLQAYLFLACTCDLLYSGLQTEVENSASAVLVYGLFCFGLSLIFDLLFLYFPNRSTYKELRHGG